jgi:selenocysteine-specific elongation factor
MIIATAGHVDHGKTTLVRALTGTDTDRLPEEKQRGLTIDLGFAYVDVADGVRLGFVDVPGHERFVKNMLAGVATIDHALLVVAADDGVMPQTVEHLAILDLLGIAHGTVALTKIDRVDAARIAAVKQQIRDLLAPTPLAGAPIFPTSGETGAGIPALRDHLNALAGDHAARATTGRFRLAVDRCFTLSGIGLVVTGAVFSGQVRAGDRLLLSPAGLEARVRGLRALDRDTDTGRAGERCAVNIAGPDVDRNRIRRGDWLVTPSAHAPTRRIDVRVKLLASEARALKHWSPVHVHLGAADITGRIALLDRRDLAPGESALAQLSLDAASHAVFADRFILRDQSAQRTIAGGHVIDPAAPARGRARPDRLAALTALDVADHGDALARLLDAVPAGVMLDAFARARNLSEEEATALFAAAAMVTVPDAGGPIGIAQTTWDQLCAALPPVLADWHARHPDVLGPQEAALARELPGRPAAGVLRAAALDLAGRGLVRRTGMVVHLPDHQPRPAAADEAMWQRVAPILEGGGDRPPRIREVAELLNETPEAMTAFMTRCVRFGRLLPVAPNRYFPPAAVRRLAMIATELAGADIDGSFDAATFKDRSGIGRNLTIELLEFFDAAGFTRRTGNQRHILRPADEVFGNE